MITEDIKRQLIAVAVDYFKNCTDEIKDKMSYEILDKLFSGETYKSEIYTAGLILAATTIVHNIPRKDKDTGIWGLRLAKECHNGLWTFVKANRLEKFCIKFSEDKTNIDLRTYKSLPTLEFLNTNYEYLVAGYGDGKPDLIDRETNITYEVKANYQKNGSISGLHTANRLMDCAGTHINVFPILYDGSVDFGNAFFRFPSVIPEELITYSHAIDPELLALIKSGEFILTVEEELAAQGFVWNT